MSVSVRSARAVRLAALSAAALAGTLGATYPLLLGRSLVSPGNGPTAVLYDTPPFVYGANDDRIEDARGTDVGAMMWAVLPYTVVQRDALANGEWPLWNRYNSNGQPLWGQGQTFILDPVHLMSLAIPDPSLAMDVRFIVGRAIFAMGTGVAVWLVTRSLAAAALLALAAPFVGHFTVRFNHPAYFSIVYAPWVLAALALGTRAATQRERALATLALAFSSWLQLVGSTPKEGVIVLAMAYLAGLVAALCSWPRWSEVLGRLDVLLGGGLLASLLGAPHWLIFLDTLSRAWTTYDRPAVELGTPAHAVAFILGTVAPGRPFTGGHPLLVVCAACALSQPGRLRRSPLAAGALASLVTAVALTFGVVPSALLARVPLIAHIHHVWDTFLTAAVPPLLVLAGVGAAALLDDGKRGRWAATALALLAAVACAWAVPGVLANTATRVGLLAVGSAALAALALRWGGRMQPVVVAVGTAAAIAGGGLHLETGIAEVDALLIQPRHRAALTTLSPAIAAVKNVATTDPFRVVPVESVLFPGTQAYWGLEGQGGPDALRLPELDVVADEGGLERTTWLWLFVLHPPAVSGASRLLDMLNVRYLVARPEHVPPGAVLLPVESVDRLRVIVRDTAWPRAFFTAAARRHRRVADFVRLLGESDGPFASVDERDFAATAAVGELPGTGGAIPASDYVLTTNTTTFRVSSPSRGLAVLGESYVEKDFEATLNGHPVPYIRVNHGFKAVVVPGAGEWTVTFRYRPALWGWSWALAGLGAVAAGALLLAAGRRGRSRAPSAPPDLRS